MDCTAVPQFPHPIDEETLAPNATHIAPIRADRRSQCLRGSVHVNGRSRSPVRAGSEQYLQADSPAWSRQRSGRPPRPAACSPRLPACRPPPDAERKADNVRWPRRREGRVFRQCSASSVRVSMSGGSGRMPGPAAARMRILSNAMRISSFAGLTASRSLYRKPRSAKLAASTFANRRKARSPASAQACAATSWSSASAA